MTPSGLPFTRSSSAEPDGGGSPAGEPPQMEGAPQREGYSIIPESGWAVNRIGASAVACPAPVPVPTG